MKNKNKQLNKIFKNKIFIYGGIFSIKSIDICNYFTNKHWLIK